MKEKGTLINEEEVDDDEEEERDDVKITDESSFYSLLKHNMKWKNATENALNWGIAYGLSLLGSMKWNFIIVDQMSYQAVSVE